MYYFDVKKKTTKIGEREGREGGRERRQEGERERECEWLEFPALWQSGGKKDG